MNKQMNEKIKPELTQKYLQSILHYNPDTGHFLWKVKRNGTKGIGSVAGYVNINKRIGYQYILIHIDGKNYSAPTLAYLYVHGTSVPAQLECDHLNHDATDNRWSNIRFVSRSDNHNNKRGLATGNKSGYVGVSPAGKKWQAQHGYHDSVGKHRKTCLGSYTTALAAAVARFHYLTSLGLIFVSEEATINAMFSDLEPYYEKYSPVQDLCPEDLLYYAE